MATDQLAQLVTRLENVVQRIERTAPGSASGDATSQVAVFISAYDNFVREYVQPYLTSSALLGGVVEKQAQLLKGISDELRNFLSIASKSSAPKQDVLVKLLTKYYGKITEMDKMQPDGKNTHANQIKAAKEGVLAFRWVDVGPTPVPYVQQIAKESVKFYTNKVRTENRQKSENGDEEAKRSMDWMNTYERMFLGLADYIKAHHTTGPSWNKSAPPATEASVGSSNVSGGVPLPPAGIPPPPPPPPPSAAPKDPGAAPSASAVSALLKDISKGTDVTKGLKKVTNDMKTYKNPELRKHHTPVPFKAKNSEFKSVNIKSAPKQPPKFRLEGKKWVVEYQENANLTIDNCEMRFVVYVYKCVNTTITVAGKVNSIVLDSCKKSGVVFNSVVSGMEVVNCQSVQVQSQGKCPTISIDKTDGCIVYLSKECMSCHIVTAKSSEMNVSMPRDDGDFDEHPIFEQFRTYWVPEKKAFVTVPSEQLG